jgi:uncharacterized protein YndB with AHSA1/START domain
MHDHATRPARDTVRLERLLPGPMERVWAFLTEPDRRARWLAAGDMQLRAGGRVELHFNHEMISPEQTPAKYRDLPMSLSGRVLRCEPPRLLAFTWLESHGEHSEVTFELTARDTVVLLVVNHRKLPDRATLLSVAAGWDTHVGILDDVLRDRPPRGFWSSHERAEREYARRFPEEG